MNAPSTMTRLEAMAAAKRMYEAGWGVEEIRKYLRRHGIKTSWARVKVWVDAEYAEEYRRRERDRMRHRNRVENGVKSYRVLDEQAREALARELSVSPLGKLSPELLLSLRVDDGLTYSAISVIARRFFNEEIAPEQVRRRLYRLGAPKNPNKTAANHRQHMRDREAA